MAVSGGFRVKDHRGRSRLTGLVNASLLLAFLAAAILSSAAAQTRDVLKNGGSLLDRADELVRSGHSADAVTLLRSFVSAHPTSFNERLVLARLYMRAAEHSRAEAELLEALRIRPGSVQAAILLGQVYENKGDLAAAERALTESVRLSPSSVETRELLAFVLAKEHKYAEADSVLRTVKLPAGATSSRINHLRLIASIQSGLGHAKAAALAMERAAQLAPSDSALRLSAAVAEAEARAWDECIRNVAPLYRGHPAADTGILLLRAQLGANQEFETTLQSLEMLGKSAEERIAIRIRSAQVLSDFGVHAQAVLLLEEVLRTTGPQQDLLLGLAAEQYHAAQIDAAQSTLSQVRQLGPSAEAEDLAGDIAESKGDYLTAVHYYQAAVELAPKVEKYRLSLGAELIRHRAYEPAILVFRQATSLFGDSPRALLGLGIAQFFQGLYDDSVSSLLRADELSKSSGDAIEYLGRTQLRRTEGPLPVVVDRICSRADVKKDDAVAAVWCSTLRFRQMYLADDHRANNEIIRQLRAANQLAPANPLAVCALGKALAWTADLAGARSWLEECVRLQPGSIEDHYRLSRVYKELGMDDLSHREANAMRKAKAEQEEREKVGEFIYEIAPLPANTPGRSPN